MPVPSNCLKLLAVDRASSELVTQYFTFTSPLFYDWTIVVTTVVTIDPAQHPQDHESVFRDANSRATVAIVVRRIYPGSVVVLGLDLRLSLQPIPLPKLRLDFMLKG